MPKKSKSRLAPIASYHVRECVLEYTFARICVCTCHFTANTATSLSPFSSLPPSFASFYSSDPLQVQRHDLSFLLLAVYFVPLSYFVSSLLSLCLSHLLSFFSSPSALSLQLCKLTAYIANFLDQIARGRRSVSSSSRASLSPRTPSAPTKAHRRLFNKKAIFPPRSHRTVSKLHILTRLYRLQS